MDITIFIEKWIWFGSAAVGFAILFNVPVRTLIPIFLMAALGGIIKLLFLPYIGIVFSSLLGCILIGLLSIFAAHFKHSPPFIFAIPAVIPMVPGTFAYFTMKGFIKLAYNTNPNEFEQILYDTVTNGSKTLFVLMAITIGVYAPMLLTRKESAKQIKIPLLKLGKK
ncbi:threonine/serine exporter family protein [Mariniflexile gromovii]|uniref:Threonine/serine exporter family protein n=1 Tax=Mariniflexile gromovii TaxID=362523 RepID=A0ABS4BYJ4_9FLAO|nr:threonine/serine exporter family protein [Mariniflexile gromovii]MBP0905655.1 threonine/serine exporter family protein [Mariniflexile gromovii]